MADNEIDNIEIYNSKNYEEKHNYLYVKFQIHFCMFIFFFN